MVIMNSGATEDIKQNWEGVDVVQDFADVFPKKFGLSPSRETEFTIELMSGTSP